MGYYIHQTPGRLRVRTPVIKDDAVMAEAARTLFSGYAGVTAVTSDARSGNVIVSFDARSVSPANLINLLAGNGFLSGIVGFPRPHPKLLRKEVAQSKKAPLPPLSPQTKKLLGLAAKILLPLLAEKAFGKSGRAIVTSLLV